MSEYTEEIHAMIERIKDKTQESLDSMKEIQSEIQTRMDDLESIQIDADNSESILIDYVSTLNGLELALVDADRISYAAESEGISV